MCWSFEPEDCWNRFTWSQHTWFFIVYLSIISRRFTTVLRSYDIPVMLYQMHEVYGPSVALLCIVCFADEMKLWSLDSISNQVNIITVAPEKGRSFLSICIFMFFFLCCCSAGHFLTDLPTLCIVQFLFNLFDFQFVVSLKQINAFLFFYTNIDE